MSDTLAPVDPPSGFADLGLGADLTEVLRELGYEEPTPIQAEAIPVLLAGRDLIGQAATGTGKTAAFALPIIERLNGHRGSVQALVLVPTRELAMQVAEAFGSYGHRARVRVVAVFGGQPIQRQLDALNRGVEVVVATPGRALDHLRRGSLRLDRIGTVVLDEADEMLDMGFAEDIEALLAAVPGQAQTVMFSATMAPRLKAIAAAHLDAPVEVRIAAAARAEGVPEQVRQDLYVVQRAHKPAALGRVLEVEQPGAAIVFCRTREDVDRLTETLSGRGFRAEALHGGMDQAQRDRVMGRLRSGAAELLVATDVAARGLDIDTLTHVVNFEVPSAPETYVHRIGRVGRAGRTGVAITLADPREMRLLANIERLTRRRMDPSAVPSVADLQRRQVDATVDRVLAAIAEPDPTHGEVLGRLLADHPAEEVARAAVALLHQDAVAGSDTTEIPVPPAPKERAARGDRPAHHDREARPGPGGARSRLSDRVPTAKVWIGIGRSAGARPADLVGAIANETSLKGADIGEISVFDRHSLVEVPAAAVSEVIAALTRTQVRGRSVIARRDRGDRRKEFPPRR